MLAKKATKFDKIFIVNLTLCSKYQTLMYGNNDPQKLDIFYECSFSKNLQSAKRLVFSQYAT